MHEITQEMWEAVLQFASERGMEVTAMPARGGGISHILVVSHVELCRAAKEQLEEIIPFEIHYEYLVGLKPSTIRRIVAVLAQNKVSTNLEYDGQVIPTSAHGLVKAMGMDVPMPQANASLEAEGHRITVNLPGELDESHPVWEGINIALRDDEYAEQWTFKVNGQSLLVISPKVQKACEGHHIRERVFTDDDMMNLKIGLGKEQDVNDYLRSLGWEPSEHV
jgi:hypothetical protein